MTTTTPPTSQLEPVRRPGRPRDEVLDDQILGATLDLVDAEEEVTVARVVALSGVSKAALYRRWPSITLLIAAALDVGRTVPRSLPINGDLREALLGAMLGEHDVHLAGISEARFRHRIRLVMADRALQKTYWSSHVVHRRVPMETALRAGIERGILRADLDVEAAFDAIAGVFYYQIVVRGDAVTEPAVRTRCRAALEMIWHGMVAPA
jgi:AcrR family transcriptional regulator